MVVHRRLRLRRDNEREEGERTVTRPVEKPLADSAAHAALRGRLLVSSREPLRVGEQSCEAGPDRLAGLRGRDGAADRRAYVCDEGVHHGRIEDELVPGHRDA